jgi:hypothetical protein
MKRLEWILWVVGGCSLMLGGILSVNFDLTYMWRWLDIIWICIGIWMIYVGATKRSGREDR